jgi:hypothetical protein
MSALAAIAIFPFLTLLLIGLSKAEEAVTGTKPKTADRVPADPPNFEEIPAD